MFKKSMCFILALLMMAVSCCALAEESTLTVRGAGVVYVDADRVTISVGVREVAAQVTDAQSAVNEKISAVISAMNDLGVTGDSISTNSIGIYPNYDYSSNEEQINGYTAYNSILVVISDVSNAGTYIDAAFAAGANSLDYVDFSAADNHLRTARKQMPDASASESEPREQHLKADEQQHRRDAHEQR